MFERFRFPLLASALALTACGGGDPASSSTGGNAAAAAAAAPARVAPSVQPTGTVIEVKMFTDDKGNYFEPADLRVRRGDVVRFVLVSGVHNVSFPASENQGAVSLPEPSPYLQLPGQTWDLLVDVEPGKYVYQCDPHAALGMVGTLEVTGE